MTIEKKTARQFLSSFRWLLIAGLAVMVGSGCAGHSPEPQATTGRNPVVAEVPNQDETLRGEEDPPIVTLEVGQALRERKLASSEDLPGKIIIPTTNLNGVPVSTALSAVLKGTDVSLSWDSSSFDDHLVTVMNLSGPLPQVIEKICAAGKVFCAYRHGSLELKDKETFIVPLPPIAKASGLTGTTLGSSGSNGAIGGSSTTSSSASLPGAATVNSVSTAAGNTMADAITELAGSKASVDDQGGNIIYTTDVEGEDHVREYLEELRNGRPLVVLQLYIWEVELKKENSEGINWNSLKFPRIGGNFEDLSISSPASAITAVAGGVTFGAVTAGKVSADLIAAFLSTQGRVQTISNPQITFVSGSSAQFMVGGQTNYISSVGQLVTASNISGTTTGSETNGVGTNTVSTATINTGLAIGVSGAYENGVVFANFNMNITNLQSLNPTSSGGETIDLPTTTNRAISTIIRVRPGDNLVMAGMVSSSDTNSRQGIPLPLDARIPMYGDDQYDNTELVIMVKPSIVLFSDKVATQEAKQKELAKPLPAALVIDKDGAKPLMLPGRQSSAEPAAPVVTDAAATPVSVPVVPVSEVKSEAAVSESNVNQPQSLTPYAGPDLMVSEPNAAQPQPLAPISDTPISASDDNAPVDQRLMQRGFSHAFDQLLQPPDTNSADASNGEEKP